VTANGYNFMYDRTGPLFANITSTANILPSSSTTGNYTISVDIYDTNNAVASSPAPRLWFGYSGTADTARTLTHGAGNRYTTTVAVALGQTLTYDFTATDSIVNSATSTPDLTISGGAGTGQCDLRSCS
jgi:hypothetical protein